MQSSDNPAMSAVEVRQARPRAQTVVPRQCCCMANGRTMVVGRPTLGDPDYNALCPHCNPLSLTDYTVQVNFIDEIAGHGLRTGMVAIFIAGEMAGISMLNAPWAVVNLGWVGFFLLLMFGAMTAYTASCLGTCWLILEERYVECRQYPCRDPYATIALKAFGKKMSYFTTACIQITLFGAATVYLMLIAQLAQKLFTDLHPEIGFCSWLFVFSITISSLMFLESPKDYCIVAVGALLTTMTACYFIIMQILFEDHVNMANRIPHNRLNSNDFFMSFGIMLFSYGGASAFPTIQNGMFKKNEFSQSVFTTFVMLAILFGSVVVGGYVVYGDKIKPNILMSLGDSWITNTAIALMAIHLILSFIIIVNPVCRKVEHMFNTPNNFGFKKFFIRMGILVAMILLGESIPNYTNLVALIGSTTVTCATFVLPPIFYLSLCSQQSPMWPDRSLSLRARLRLYIIITMGLLGGAGAMVVAVTNLLKVEACYLSYVFSATTYE